MCIFAHISTKWTNWKEDIEKSIDASITCLDLLGCRSRGGIFLKVKRLVRNCSGTRKRVFLGFFCFSPYICGNLEKQKLFFRICFAHKTTYAYLSLFICCWNIQEILDSDLFWAGDGWFQGDFPPFCVLTPREQTRELFYCTQRLMLLRRIFWAYWKQRAVSVSLPHPPRPSHMSWGLSSYWLCIRILLLLKSWLLCSTTRFSWNPPIPLLYLRV